MKRFTRAFAVAMLAAGCSTSEPPSPPPATPPAGVSVSLVQWRSDEPLHAIHVAVRNTTNTPVFFADLQLVTPSFKTLPAQKTDAIIKRTERTDLRIPYGAGNCLPQGLPEVRPATVVAHLSTGSEQPHKVVFNVPHPDPLLARLLRDECSEYLIKQVAGIEFGPEWKQSGKAMLGTLVITRRTPGKVTLSDMGGTTHYIVTPERRPLGTLEAGAQRLEVPITLTPGRCDAHAFAEAKKAFLFPVRASVDGGQERVVIVTPPQPERDRLIKWAAKVCGLEG
ncbi:hypothetical protein [Nonomuraea turcica]|uniref:hypothetical protein n=1 Tax=Nonomuraea sp. G32 TaxID=3067274 RepID=UPI00273CBE55|nr:hypothetical protein [Nonomuraea sp. G32]MDP4508448.1 hypothetical protein [Nonomuraea sp. G32]